MNKLTNLLKNFAVKNWQKYSFKKEWQSVILLMLILKISTSAVSIFSGFFYLDNFFFSFTDSEIFSKIIAVVALLLIECLCALFLAKFFKFALRAEIKTALMPFFCALLIFAVSFVISTNGIALFTSQSEDLSKEINKRYSFAISELKKEYSESIKQTENYINTIQQNPENWLNGKRCILSEKQNTEIAKAFSQITNYKTQLNSELKKIEIERKNELSENAKETTNKADKFYKIVAFIMLVQIACSGGLWFFYSKIAQQDAPENEYKEAINEIYTNANNLIDNGLNACINQKFSIISTAFLQLQNDLQTKQIQAENDIKKEKLTPPEQNKKVGFDIPKPAPEQTEKTPVKIENQPAGNVCTRGVSNVNSVILTPSKNALTIKKCAFCGKPLTDTQNARKAKFCSANCRVKHYNKTHPERKQITLKNENLKH
jgi:endogenous inhibitor of DNA gyrase (YacG/DUF329 family)